MNRRNGKYPLLFMLYIGQSVPMSFISTVIPVIMRQNNFSLESIGMLQLIKLPWILKFLWAPFVDRYSCTLRGLKRWIFISEIIYASAIFTTAFYDIQADFHFIIKMLVLAFAASATQDIASDSLAINILSKKERGPGNSMQAGGSFIGTLLGTGVLLILFHDYGWKIMTIGIAFFALVILTPLLFSANINADRSEYAKKVKMGDSFRFFLQRGSLRRLFLLILFNTGIVGVLTMIKPLLVDVGFNTKEIGIISGIVGTGAASLFALSAGFIIKKMGLKNASVFFLSFAFFAVLNLLIFPIESGDYFRSYLGVSLVWASYGALAVALYTFAMNNVRKGLEGTDFTVQIVLSHLGSLAISVLSGKISSKFDYSGLFLVELGLIILTSMIVIFGFSKNEYESSKTSSLLSE